MGLLRASISSGYTGRQSWLSWFYRGLLLLGFLFLLGRLSDLQVIKGEYYRELSENNRIRRVSIKAPRGDIVARGGEILAGSIKEKKAIVFNPDKGYLKVDDLEGVAEDQIVSEYRRVYKLASSAGHLTGYLGRVSKEELGKINPDCLQKGPYKADSLIGRTGLEEMYECYLSGTDGEELVEVDSSGKMVRVLGRRTPQPGGVLRTSIHFGLQKKIAEIMRKGRQTEDSRENRLPDAKGAVVVTDTKGAVLALYSSPSFDPNILTLGRVDKVSKILSNKNLPLFNRVISGAFHPGSVFKPMVAIAALEEGVIDEDYLYEDTGRITIESLYGSFSYSNWYFTQYGGTEGKINLTRALARSTDTFFYKLGELTTIDKLVYWMDKFRLGKKAGIDLPGEAPGLIPSPEWKEKVKGERWFLGNTYHFSIGQGDIALTPLSLNQAVSMIAADGKWCAPKVVGESECQDLGIKKGSINLVKEGMVEACNSGGTAYTFFEVDSRVACKTGTAETPGSEKPHAWFTFFAPVDFPEIVVTVLVEEGGEGSRVAGPIAREIYDYWFAGN